METSKTTLLLAACAAAAYVGSTHAAPILYEPFDYTAGAVGTASSADIGFDAGEWTTTDNFEFIGTGLDGPATGESGGAFGRASRSSNGAASRGVSGSTTALTTPSAIYFSLLIDTAASYEKGNNLTVLLGTDGITDPGNTPMGGGGATVEGIGLSFRHSGNQAFLRAQVVDDGTVSVGAGEIGPVAENTLLFVVGEITWGATDTVTLYNVTDVNAPLPAAFSTVSGDLDESQFDTLTIGDKQEARVDEILFGTSLTDVGVVPEPGSLALLGLGGLLIARRRRGLF